MHLLTTPDSTTLSYWLNWRVLLCAIWVFTPAIAAMYIIRKCEHFKSLGEKSRQGRVNLSNSDVAWRPCLDWIHPIWLLAYRITAFCFLVATLFAKLSSNGFHMFFFYTQFLLKHSEMKYRTSSIFQIAKDFALSIVPIFALYTSSFLNFAINSISILQLVIAFTEGFRNVLNIKFSPHQSSSEAPWLIYKIRWTFTLVTIYFGYGALLSVYGCYQHRQISTVSNNGHVESDAEQGYHVPLMCGERPNDLEVKQFLNLQAETHVSRAARISCHLFQIVYQISAGAVMFTDLVYWSVIFPYFSIKDYSMNFMTVNMHSLNAVLLLVDTALNSLPFPWFRIAYFILWTASFVIFQWIFHACVLFWWPYPFLDLSSHYAPIWYLLMACLHLPCYGSFVVITKMKHFVLSKWCPRSYQYVRQSN